MGSGLSKLAARELDLLEGTPVGASIIDAHAGGLGMLGCDSPDYSVELTARLGTFSEKEKKYSSTNTRNLKFKVLFAELLLATWQ